MRRPRHTTISSSTTTVMRLLLILAAITVLATACGSSDDATSDVVRDDEFAESAGEDMEESGAGGEIAAEAPGTDAGDAGGDGAMAEEEAAADQDAAGDEATSLGSAGAVPTQRTAADFGRQIIFTADITVEVDDVAAAGREATTIIEGIGGFVFGQQTQGGSEPRSVLVFKVLPDDFDRAVEALGAVGELRNQTISADDVTERVVDLETRIEVAELGVERLRETLTNTQNLEDYAELERLLLERETELEIMRGQLRTLQDRIDLATITLTLLQDAVNHSISLNASLYHTQDDGVSCPGTDEWFVEAGTDLTLCLEIVNTGEEPVADLALIDTALGIDSADELTLVYGELDRLEAGQSVMLAHEFSPDRPVRVRTKATARPITEEGESAGPSVDAGYQDNIEVFEPEGDPGFGEGFDAGLSVLRGIWTVITVAVGFALPLLVLLVIIGPLLWLGRGRISGWRRTRRSDRLAATPPPPPPGPNPPPPPSGEPATAGSGDGANDAPPPGPSA
jgi:hypothetical protein